MIGDSARAELIAHLTDRRQQSHVLIDFDLNQVTEERLYSQNDNVYSTQGFYFLSYVPFTRQGKSYGKHKGFRIVVDMGEHYTKRYRHWKEFHSKWKTDPVVNFLLKYTNISKELFEIVQQVENWNTRFPFCLDVVKYNNDVKKKNGIERVSYTLCKFDENYKAGEKQC